MRGVQAVGPYFLLGHSFGGLVALEIAQLLVAEQDKVACLIMLDTPTPEKIWPPVFYLTSRVAKLRRLLARLSGASLGENLAAFRRSASLRNTDLNEMPTDVMIGTNVARVLLAHGIAREAYRPKFYPGKVIFFRPLEAPSRYETLWPKRVGEMEVLPAAGGHLSMVELPHAPLLAAQLSACIKALLF
jgi:thioesterase domain-containing protein